MEVEIDYGRSKLFTVRELDRAIEAIREEFDSWEGCELHSISYAGDSSSTRKNLRWLNDLDEGNDYVQCAEFLSNFHSPVEQYGSWNPDTEYIDWQWWLGQTADGDWELVSWGY